MIAYCIDLTAKPETTVVDTRLAVWTVVSVCASIQVVPLSFEAIAIEVEVAGEVLQTAAENWVIASFGSIEILSEFLVAFIFKRMILSSS